MHTKSVSTPALPIAISHHHHWCYGRALWKSQSGLSSRLEPDSGAEFWNRILKCLDQDRRRNGQSSPWTLAVAENVSLLTPRLHTECDTCETESLVAQFRVTPPVRSSRQVWPLPASPARGTRCAVTSVCIGTSIRKGHPAHQSLVLSAKMSAGAARSRHCRNVPLTLASAVTSAWAER